jgi:hypothetical protein
MDANIISALFIILVVAGGIVTGLYNWKRSKKMTGIIKWMVGYRGFSYIVGAILILFILLYYFLRQLSI